MDFSNPMIWNLAGVSAVAWYLCGAVLAVAVILFCLLRRVNSVTARCRDDENADIASYMDYPPVSVIVYAHSDERTLEELVEQIYAQDYPAAVEVIVTIDRAYDATEDVVSRLLQRHPYMRHTFAPLEARNVSRRKLALTLGIKAACHDTVLITSGNCMIPSDTWLKRMVRHVAAGNGVVAGHAVTVPVSNDSASRHPGLMRRFDALRDSLLWFSAALTSRVMRSASCNVVYTRKAFFDNHGFASSLGLNFGDDDILVEELSRRSPSAVELSPSARVFAREERPDTVMKLDRLRHDFTSRYLPIKPRLIFAVINLSWWLFTILAAVAVIAAWPKMSLIIALALLAVAIIVCYTVCWHRASKALGIPVPAVAIPWLMWAYPFHAVALGIYGLRNKRENFTWNNI